MTLDGIPARLLARRWGTGMATGTGAPPVELHARLPSALDAVHALGAAGAPAGAVVIAEEQTAGRGREGRTWHSPLGGVWLAMLFRPASVQAGLGGGSAVSIRAGLVVADVVDELLGRSAARLKWPNDVLIDSRKVAGVLCESRWQGDRLLWLGVGVGVNVANPISAELAERAVALHELLPGVRRLDVLDRLVPGLARITAHALHLTDSECAAFAERDWLLGRRITKPVSGIGRGLREDGALVVQGENGAAVVRDGHVELA